MINYLLNARRQRVLLAASAALLLEHSGAAAIYNGKVEQGLEAVVAIGRNTRVCSGSLIAPNIVLTAAHCFKERRASGVLIGDGSGSFHQYDIKDIAVHPQFNIHTLDNDIALALLAAEASISLLKISQTRVAPGNLIKIAGYGISEASTVSTATEKRSGNMLIKSVSSTSFVAKARPSVACRFDSGGPALIDGKIVGVISVGDIMCSQVTRLVRIDVHRKFVATTIAGWS